MESTIPKDKLTIDVSDKDDRELAEHLSRMEAGDSISGRFTATLDENADGLAVLSITEIIADPEIESPKKKKKTKNTEVAESDNELAAVKVMRGQSEDDDLPPDPIPSGEPAARQAPSQPYSPDELVR